MATFKVVVGMLANSGVPKDTVENTFHLYHATEPTSADFDNARDDLADFYNATPAGGGGPIKNILAKDLDYVTDHDYMKFYRIPATPGPLFSPVAERTWSLGAPAAAVQPLPDQVAIVLSFQADQTGAAEEAGSTRPKSRRRNRIYIGPLNVAVLEETAGALGPQTVNPAVCTNIGKSAAALQAALIADGWVWATFSPTEWEQRSVINGWVDDRFDTQRRRLHEADSRIFWP